MASSFKTHRIISIFLLLLAIGLFQADFAVAQDAGTLTGFVKDDEGLPLPGVGVTVEGAGGKKNTYTDAKGAYAISGLAPGPYDVSVELSGFVTITQTDVQVTAGSMTQDFVMKTSTVAELVVVTASRVETPLINAPATMSVVGSETIEASPAQNYADLLRSVPGLNVTQTSARDINLTSRQANSTLATSQLALLDGRSIYLDFFGFVGWDFLPVNFDEIKQVEVIRGPASAVWGANALTGVVNIITKTPRETPGTSILITGGVLDRDVEDDPTPLDSGGAFGANIRYAQAVNDTWAYKLSVGYFTQDEFARPVGFIPRETVPGTNVPTGGAPYSAADFKNDGTSQPKFDFRLDQDLSEDTKIIYTAGYAGTDGIIHTGIGPFQIDSGSFLAYGKVGYSKGNLRLGFFTNILDADSQALLAIGTDGKPLPFAFKSQTYDFDAAHSVVVAEKNILSFGGNYRRNNFDLEIAPEGEDRNELGAYFQEEFFTDHFRLLAGIRVDKFSVIDDPVFSPRVTGMWKPTPEHSIRASFNRAFRSPSQINNFLDTAIITGALNLRVLEPITGPLPCNLLNNCIFPIITTANGNADLTEEQLNAYEIGYTGEFNGRTTVNASFYVNDTDNNINFTPTGIYSAVNPPLRWPFPGALFTICINTPGCVVQGSLPFVSNFTYLNLGPLRQKGFEVGFDSIVNSFFSVYANYSFQSDPEILDPGSDDEPRFPESELGFPPNHRFNAGMNFNSEKYLGSFSVNYTSDAFWTDVLTPPFFGPTDDYTAVNVSFGRRWMEDHITTTLKINNLFNDDMQQHVFGDVIKRSIYGEVRFDF